MDQVCTLLGSSNKSCILGTVLEDLLNNCIPLPLPKESSIRHRRWADAANTAPELYVTCRDSLDELLSVVERHAACCKQPSLSTWLPASRLLRWHKAAAFQQNLPALCGCVQHVSNAGKQVAPDERRAVFDFVSSRAVKSSFPRLYNKGLEAVS